MEHPFYISLRDSTNLEVKENYILIKRTNNDSITFELMDDNNQSIRSFNLTEVITETMNGGSNAVDSFTPIPQNEFNSSASISDAGDDLYQMDGGLNSHWYKSNKRTVKQKKNISIRNRNQI